MTEELNKDSAEVRKITSKEAYPYILLKHYAKRIPSISFAYGLFIKGELVGIVTYGKSSSSPLAKGVCGPEHAEKVYELNRLCLDEGLPKNSASFLVARSLRILPKPKIIVSYADTGNGHIGYVYQATNFIYTGLSAKRTDWKIKGMEHLHGQTIADKSRGMKDRAAYMRKLYGDRFYLSPRPRKHRYVIFLGCDKETVAALRYKKEPFPKGETKRHNESVIVK